jgi:uncharacterized protein
MRSSYAHVLCMEHEQIGISVAYALADRQEVIKLTVTSGTTAAQAVALSGLAERFPEISTMPLNCAIYSRVVPPTEIVRQGDRVEILRPLLIDPKESRRQAAAKSSSRKR